MKYLLIFIVFLIAEFHISVLISLNELMYIVFSSILTLFFVVIYLAKNVGEIGDNGLKK